jgi:fused signal recognition particle receptor
MAEEKPGLFKRIFSFGFGKKQAEEVLDEAASDPSREAAEQAARLKAEKAEKKAAKAALEAEQKAAEDEKQRALKAEKDAAFAEKKAKELEQESARKAEEKRLEDEKAALVAAKKREETESRRKAKGAEEAEKLKQKAENEQLEAAKRQEKEAEKKKIAEARAKKDRESVPDGGDDDFAEGHVPTPPEELVIEESVVTLTARKEKKSAEPEPQPDEERRSGWLSRLTKGLTRSSTQLKENISQVFTNRKLDDNTIQDLEDVLIQADLGVETATAITDALSGRKFGKEVTEQEVREVMAEEIEKILEPVAKDLDLDLDHQPHVILVVGVNGSGKTTTIGKLASKLYDAGFSTTLVAGDTFRAAAIEQLKIWGERTQSPVLSRPLGSDAAGLAFDAWAETHEQRRDVMLMDTAGRLQNRTELMAELEKIVRVLKKQDPTAPHTVLLTLDATTGQNALNQVEIFKNVAGVNGLVMTKLDGTARGGILVAISAKHKLPVYFVGVGEQVADLEPFEAREFARSIAGLPREDA